MALPTEAREAFRTHVRALLEREPGLSPYAILAKLSPGAVAHRQALLSLVRDELLLNGRGVAA